MKRQGYLLIDFGSTYTKLTLIDIEAEEIVAQAQAMTTVQTSITEGFQRAYDNLQQQVDFNRYTIVKRLACSSAKGGLKMVTLGLVPELTVEASKRAALGAGARVMKAYSYELTNREIDEIKQMDVDMILLSGGTDGGNEEVILENAKKLALHFKHLPIVVAGNKVTYDRIEMIFSSHGINAHFTENVLPSLNTINVEPVREVIRQLFMDTIIRAKGLDEVSEWLDGILMPTPASVLKASELLARGTQEEPGLGDLIVIDIGGATTDVHSLAEGIPTKPGVNWRGLQEPYAKRTVEGDLGMRISARSLFDSTSYELRQAYLPQDDNLSSKIQYREDNPDYIATSIEEVAIDEGLAKIATKRAMRRHVGRIEVVYTPLGEMYNQIGKDLLETKNVIGTGGVIVHSKKPEEILRAGLFDPKEPIYLVPKHPQFLVDERYILSAMGLLAMEQPEVALRMMKKYLTTRGN